MAKFNTGQSFADGDQVTGAKLNNIIGLLDIYSGVIADQASIAATVSTADLLLIADTDAGSSGAANKVTVQKLLNDTLTGGTFTNANIAEQFTYGTATGNRTVSTNAVITNGTITTALIPTGTFGTTTSTAATITTGTIPTLTAGTTTSTAGIFTSGTIATLNSTTGIVATLNSTTGTVQTLTSSTATVSEIVATKNIAINVTTLATATGTQNLDFTSQGYLTHSITGDITYTASNYAAGKSLSVRITCDGTQRNLTFPTNWVFVGSKPTAIAASKIAILSVTSFGATEANTVAAYAVQT